MKCIHLLRKPCSESTVAGNVLAHGCGALNINASRINVSSNDVNHRPGITNNTDAAVTSMFGVGAQRRGSLGTGRWPANLILMHLPGCTPSGTRRVKASAPASGPTLWGASTSVSRGKYGGVAASATHGDADGMETVATWACEPGCPVRELDEQSGVSSSTTRPPTGKPIYPTGGDAGSMAWNANSVMDTTERGHTDAGGASRFFKHVGGAGKPSLK